MEKHTRDLKSTGETLKKFLMQLPNSSQMAQTLHFTDTSNSPNSCTHTIIIIVVEEIIQTVGTSLFPSSCGNECSHSTWYTEMPAASVFLSWSPRSTWSEQAEACSSRLEKAFLSSLSFLQIQGDKAMAPQVREEQPEWDTKVKERKPKMPYFLHIQDVPETVSVSGHTTRRSALQQVRRQSKRSDNAWHTVRSTYYTWAWLFVLMKPFQQ